MGGMCVVLVATRTVWGFVAVWTAVRGSQVDPASLCATHAGRAAAARLRLLMTISTEPSVGGVRHAAWMWTVALAGVLIIDKRDAGRRNALDVRQRPYPGRVKGAVHRLHPASTSGVTHAPLTSVPSNNGLDDRLHDRGSAGAVALTWGINEFGA